MNFRPVGRSAARKERNQGVTGMAKVVAAITTSVDGYIAGPDDGPEKGLGEGGERLH